MSNRYETVSELPTYEEMQAAMRAGRRLRAEAFAEFFGFGASAAAKKPAAKSDRPAPVVVQPAAVGA